MKKRISSSMSALTVEVEDDSSRRGSKHWGRQESKRSSYKSEPDSTVHESADGSEKEEEDNVGRQSRRNAVSCNAGIGAALTRTLTNVADDKAMVKEEARKSDERKSECESKAKRECGWGREGILGVLPHEFSRNEAASRCARVVERENSRLPQCMSEERIARRRPPKNRTDSLLRSGMQLEQVAKIAAMRVIEEWVYVLRAHVGQDGYCEYCGKLSLSCNMAKTLAGIIHSTDRPMSQSRSLPSLTSPTGFDGQACLVLNPNPTPPADSLLGAALRRLVPANGGHCEFVEDIMAAFKLEDDFIPSSPSHIGRPNTAMRFELSDKQMHEDDLDWRLKPPCLKMKDEADTSHFTKGAAHKHVGLNATLRLSGSCGGWATFSQSSSNRVTALGFTAKLMLDQPGPGEYKRPVSVMRACRVSKYPSVGKLRPVGHAVMGSNTDRFEVKFV